MGGIKMKQFNLQEYLANQNRQVVTREGQKVRIVCADRAGLNAKPIVALITLPNGDEVIKTFWNNGFETTAIEGENDLFFAPEKHEGWIVINKWPDGVRDTNGIIYHTKLDIPDIPPESIQLVAPIKIEWEE